MPVSGKKTCYFHKEWETKFGLMSVNDVNVRVSDLRQACQSAKNVTCSTILLKFAATSHGIFRQVAVSLKYRRPMHQQRLRLKW